MRGVGLKCGRGGGRVLGLANENRCGNTDSLTTFRIAMRTCSLQASGDARNATGVCAEWKLLRVSVSCVLWCVYFAVPLPEVY